MLCLLIFLQLLYVTSMNNINIWTENSIVLANQRNYLDLLYKIYPVCMNLKRELPKDVIQDIRRYFNKKEFDNLLKLLLKQEKFPIKDSYVAYLKRDPTSLDRNPLTCQRLSGILCDMGVDEIIDNSTVPKESNRQIGPLFKTWVNSGALGCKITDDIDIFISSTDNMIFSASDNEMQQLAKKFLGYTRDKGLDFICRFNKKYIIGEAKFLTDFGGHQNAQFDDAISTLISPLRRTKNNVKTIAILDGVLYINSNNKMHNLLLQYSSNYTILSSILLRDFIFSL